MARRVIRARVPQDEFLSLAARYAEAPLDPRQVHGYTMDIDDLNHCLRVLVVVDANTKGIDHDGPN